MRNPETTASSQSFTASTTHGEAGDEACTVGKTRRPEAARIEDNAESLADRLMGAMRSGSPWEDHARELLVTAALHTFSGTQQSTPRTPRDIHHLLVRADHLDAMLAPERVHPRVWRSASALRAAPAKDRAIVQLVALAYLKRWMANQRMSSRGSPDSPSHATYTARPRSAVPTIVGTTGTLVETHVDDPDAVSIRTMPDPLFRPRRPGGRKRTSRRSPSLRGSLDRRPAQAGCTSELHDILSSDEPRPLRVGPRMLG